MSNIVSPAEIVDGTESGDIIVGAGGDGGSTLNGGGGNDLLIGDHAPLFEDATAANNSLASAMNIDSAANWSTRTNPDVGDPSVPYTTVLGTGAGAVDWFLVTLEAGATITLDVDWALGVVGGGDGSDTTLSLHGPDGTTLAENFSASFRSGGEGSTVAQANGDPYLVFTAVAAGVYAIQVRAPGGPAIPTGARYMLNVSATGHTAGDGGAFGSDVLNGGAGNDVLYGVDGDDTLNGGDGNDTFDAGAGTDQVFGDAGADTLFEDQSSSTTPFTSSALTGTLAGGYSGSVGDATTGVTTFTGIEQFRFRAGSGDDILSGGDGSDILDAGAGNDTLISGAGADQLSGGPGDDIYVVQRHPTFFDTSNAAVVEAADQGYDEVRALGGFLSSGNIEKIVSLTLGSTITGDAGANLIMGSTEQPAANLSPSPNRFNGGAGADVLVGSPFSANILDGGAGADTMSGGVRGDEFIVDDAGDVVIDDQDDPVTTGDDDRVITFLTSYTLGASVENLAGRNLAQTLIGNARNNILGGDVSNQSRHEVGADSLYGMAGDDILIASPDVRGVVLDGGEGNDLLIATFSDFRDPLNPFFLFDEVQDFSTATFNSIETLSFREAGPFYTSQAIFRSSQIGAGLSPTLFLIAPSGSGFTPRAASVQAIFNMDTASIDLSGFTFSEGSIILGIPSGGWTAADRIIVRGSDAANTIIGSSRTDTLRGGGGNDILDGGADNDTADFSDKTAGVELTLDRDGVVAVTVNGVVEDTLLRIENATGGSGADRLFGDALANVVSGGGGNDVLDGLSGDDTINGGEGDDLLGGSDGVDRIDGGNGRDHLFGGAGNDILSGNSSFDDEIGDVLEGDDGNDQLSGGDGDDWLVGGAGNDALSPGLGVNVLVGGEGLDLVNLIGRSRGAWLDLADGHFSTTDAWATLIEIDGAIGTNSADALYGSGAGDQLFGRNGADVLFGRGGNDAIAGEAGNDYLDGGEGDDRLTGGAGVDQLIGGAGADVFDLGVVAGWDVARDFDRNAGDRIDLGGLRFGFVVEKDADGDGVTDTVLLYEGGTFVVLGVTGLTLDEWNGLVL